MKNKSNFYVINLIIRKASNNEDLTPVEYSLLFRDFYLSTERAKSSKEKECLLITNVETKISNDSSVFFGRFVEYTNIDRRKWFNIVKKEIDSEFQVPDNLRANSKLCNYFFISDIHRFCYSVDSKNTITPENVQTFLINGFDYFLSKNYPNQYYTEINFEKRRETIDEILNAQIVYSLTVDVSYSNGDFQKDAMQFFSDDLREGNIDSAHFEFKNKNGEPLEIEKSKIMKGALENSISQGSAVASIKNGKKKKTIKTSDHPAKIEVPFEPEYESLKDIYTFFKSLF